ncbi:MAG: ABC transporter ATP-binding protein [Lachnospiraceae bacterium]
MFGIIKKLRKILNKKQKQRVAILAVMIVIGGLLETVSVSMILPIMQAIMSENALEENAMVAAIAGILHITSLRTFVVVMLFGMAGVFVLKNAYMLFLTYVQHTFITNNQFRTSGDLLDIYLNKPYSFYLNSSTGDIMRTIYSDTTSVFSVLLQCLQILTEVIVALCLGMVIFLSDPAMTLVIAGVLLLAMLISNRLMKKKLSEIGEDSRKYQGKMYGSILQSMTGIKDVKVFAKEDAFSDRYKKYGRKYYSLLRDSSVFGSVPKLVVETSCMAGIMVYLAVMILAGHEVAEMLPQLTAFALAAMRLMPCASRVSTYMANIAYYKPALDFVYENVDLPGFLQEKQMQEAQKKSMPQGERIHLRDKIELQHIFFKYPNSEKYIFQDANMTIHRGESVGIVGTTGAGKSTIVDILIGLLAEESGKVLCDGQNVRDNVPSWLANLGYIPQTINLMDDTIRANVAFGYEEESFTDEQVWNVLEEAQLGAFVRELPEGLDTKIGERGVRLSGGQRQRIGIARALFHDPELLILDEATSALDNDTEAAIMDAINHFHGRKTMLIIAHRLKTIENCDVVYRVENGKIERDR